MNAIVNRIQFIFLLVCLFSFHFVFAQKNQNKKVSAFVEMPFYNFISAKYNNTRINKNGFGGLELGLKIYSKKNSFITGSLGFKTNQININIHPRYINESSRILFGYMTVANNHSINKLKFSYGISLNNINYTNNYYDANNNLIQQSEDAKLIGLNCMVGYAILEPLDVGVSFQSGLGGISRKNNINNFTAISLRVRYSFKL